LWERVIIHGEGIALAKVFRDLMLLLLLKSEGLKGSRGEKRGNMQARHVMSPDCNQIPDKFLFRNIIGVEICFKNALSAEENTPFLNLYSRIARGSSPLFIGVAEE
jgi:hypothetical protein